MKKVENIIVPIRATCLIIVATIIFISCGCGWKIKNNTNLQTSFSTIESQTTTTTTTTQEPTTTTTTAIEKDISTQHETSHKFVRSPVAYHTYTTSSSSSEYIFTTTELHTSPFFNEKNADNNLGTFRITVYTPSSDGGAWGYATATPGERSRHLATCAVDPSVIPLGSTIEVNGLTLRAIDVGGKVKGKIIDVFFDGTDKEAREWLNSFGEQHTVTIIESV